MIYLLAVNVLAFALYGIDKGKAIRRAWRIPEKVLILIAFAGGGLGAWMGMMLFHHKTKHIIFEILVPLSCLVWIVVLLNYMI